MLQIFTFVATQLYRYGRDLLFFLLVVCVCARFGFVMSMGHGTWDMMGHDGLGSQVVLFGTVHCKFTFSLHSFFGIHGKGPGGLGLAWVWVGLLVHHISFIFSGTHVW